MPLQATSGAASYDAFGGGVVAEPNYIESCFSTWLYTGNGSTQTINNGIDLAGKGGLVWIKDRNNSNGHYLTDTARGVNSQLRSHSTAAATTSTDYITSFNASGFEIGTNGNINTNGNTQVAWTFRKAPKFFDVVTYTGNGTAGRTVSHNLGSVPGCIIIKRTDAAMNWYVYHRYDPTKYLVLNQTAAAASFAVVTATSDTTFTLPADGSTNGNGSQYVAYIFAHNAGGFGLSGTDNVISCGSYTGNGSSTGPVINLGYEPQWLMIKNASDTGGWLMFDNMRGMPIGFSDALLFANESDAESATITLDPTATGFQITSTSPRVNGNGNTLIYIAIRRGPMKVPTTGTSVFEPVVYTGNGATTRVVNTNITPDAAWFFIPESAQGEYWFDRLRGGGNYLRPHNSAATVTWTGAWLFDVQNAVQIKNATFDYINGNGVLSGLWALKRAPSFFDEVCYTGTGANTTVAHNLAAAPELMIVKSRSTGSTQWRVYSAGTGAGNTLFLSFSDPSTTASDVWNDTAPTSSVFSLGTNSNVNASGSTYVNYLFATCPGVSKVGTFTGTGATQTINCGFTGGARFVLIKSTSATGDWYVWDSARGIVSGNDPYLVMNTLAAEVTGTDWVDTAATGFELSNAGGNLVNSSGVSYIFLAIA